MQAGAQPSSGKKPAWYAALLSRTDSLIVQLVLILLLGMSVLQISSFLVVCDVQLSYVRQAEKSRAEYLVTYWTILEALPPSRREDALALLRASERPQGLREMVEISKDQPDWIMEKNTPVIAHFLTYAREALGTNSASKDTAVQREPGILARMHENEDQFFTPYLPCSRQPCSFRTAPGSGSPSPSMWMTSSLSGRSVSSPLWQPSS